MSDPEPAALIAQLKELNERSRTYGRQFWQVPFAYIAGAGVALVQVTDKPSIALRITLITIAGVGGFAVWHLSYLYRAARRAFDAIRDVEAKLSLPPTATNWTPEHLVALLTLTISTALGSLLSGLYLFLCGR